MSAVVVVGGSGVLGRRAIAHLREAGHDVTALVRSPEAADRLTSSNPANSNPAHSTAANPKTVVGNVWDRAFLRHEFVGADAVVMLATAIPRVMDAGKAKAWRQNDRVRAVLAPQVAQAAREVGVSRFVQESVMFVYADGGDALIAEDSLVEPAPQAVACLTAEHGARRFRLDRGDEAQSVVLRFAWIVAADSDQSRQALEWARRGRALLLGDLNGYVTFVDVDDAASAVVRALDVPSGTYNVGGDPIRKVDHLRVLADVVDRRSVKSPPGAVRLAVAVTMPMSRTLARSLRIDSSKLRELGWRPRRESADSIWAAAEFVAG